MLLPRRSIAFVAVSVALLLLSRPANATDLDEVRTGFNATLSRIKSLWTVTLINTTPLKAGVEDRKSVV